MWKWLLAGVVAAGTVAILYALWKANAQKVNQYLIENDIPKSFLVHAWVIFDTTMDNLEGKVANILVIQDKRLNEPQVIHAEIVDPNQLPPEIQQELKSRGKLVQEITEQVMTL